ncbi:MAG: DUF3857 domain-containing protein [Lewinella sp.]
MAENNSIEAKSFFIKALKGADAADAALALSFVEANLDNRSSAIDYFVKFYQLEKDATRRNAYVDAVWSSNNMELSAGQIKMMESLLENDYTRLAALANYSLGTHYSLKNEPEKAREHFAKLGMTEAWQILGHFENISESGFDRDFGVLANPGPKATFTNKLGAEIRWFSVRHLPMNRWLYFGNHLVTQNSNLYAQTFCTSPDDREVTMRLGTSGSVKVWVNDVLMFSEATERDNHLDTYVFTAPLKAGNNRILVQNGATDKTGANFMLRITDKQGKIMEDLAFSDEYTTYPKGGAWTPKIIENPTVAYFEKIINSGNANIAEYAALSQFYLLNGFLEETRGLLLQNLEKHPESIVQMGELAVVLSQLDDDRGASTLKQYIKQKAPESMTAFHERFDEAEAVSDWKTYEQLLIRYKELYGESQFTLLKDISLAGKREELEGMIALIDEGVKKFPEDADMMVGKSKVASQLRKNPEEAIKILEDYSKRHYRSNVQEELISLYYNAGNTDKVEAILKSFLDRQPLGVNYYSRLARLYQQKGNLKKAQVMLDEAVKIAPYSSSFYQSIGSIYVDGKMEEKAKAAYRKAIALNPYDYDSRDALRDLTTGNATAFSVLPETDYYANYASAPGIEDYPNDNSVVLNYDVDQVVYPGGASEMRTTLLIKILKPEGIERWKEYSIGLYGQQKGVVEKVEVLSPDGSRHEASRNGKDIVFDGLEVGDALYLSYRIKDFKYGRLSSKFWNSHPMQLSYPIVHSAYRLLVPEDTKFRTEITGPKLESMVATESKLDGRTLYTWKSEDQPGVVSENTMPAYDDVLTQVRVSNIADWSFIADWYGELTYAKIRPDDYVKKEVAALFKDKEDLDERAQVELIYEYIVSNIRYISVPFLQSNYIPQTAAKTLTTGQGDCKDVSSLFVAMCDLRGINANLVLVSTRDQARTDLALPGTGFNHCIAKVGLGGKDYFVELTDENLPFGTGDMSVNNSFAVVIPRKGEKFAGGAGLINPPTRGVNAVFREGEVTFEGKDMLFEFRNRRENSVASNLRYSYEQDSPTNREKTMLESLSGRYPRISLTKVEFDESLNNLSPIMTYTYGYRAEDVETSIGGMKLYEIKLSDVLESPAWVATETRKLPIDLWQLFTAELYEQTVMVNTPEGKKLVEIPEGRKIENEYLSYELKFEAKDGGLEVYRKLQIKKDLVPPAAYPDFREDVRNMVEGDKITLAFR